jgi:hypothetical protein
LNAVFKSVILLKPFKNFCFLNLLFSSTDLKSANSLHPGKTKKIYFARGEFQRNVLQEDKDLFTQKLKYRDLIDNK